jgi:hypothetical protein
VSNEIFTFYSTKGILELRSLDEDIVLWIHPTAAIGVFRVKREPFLDSFPSSALHPVEEKYQVKYQRNGKN